MTHQVSLSDKTFAKIQKHAIPLVDTIETTIVRLIDELEALKAVSNETAGRLFDPASPPDLSHTTVVSARLNGAALKPADTYWNNIYRAAIKTIAQKGIVGDNLAACITSNKFVGKKSDDGYKFIEEAGISVQGLDANNAWKAIHFLCTVAGINLEVTFRWQEKEGVKMPGEIGKFVI